MILIIGISTITFSVSNQSDNSVALDYVCVLGTPELGTLVSLDIWGMIPCSNIITTTLYLVLE